MAFARYNRYSYSPWVVPRTLTLGENMNKDDIGQIVKSGIRSIAASVPIAASFSQAWTEYETVAQSKRIDQFFADFQQQIEHSAERIKKVEEHIAKSGEIPALIERTVEKVRRESVDAKRKSFAIAITNIACAGPQLPYDDKVNLIETLDELTIEDIRILSVFAQHNALPGEFFFGAGGWSQIGKPPPVSISDSRMVVSLSKLLARGLIGESSDTGDMRTWSGDATHWINQWRLENLELLPMGKIFSDILKENT